MTMQIVLCMGCNKPLDTGPYGLKRYHADCYIEHRKTLEKMRARIRLSLKIGRICKRCGGKLGSHKQRYCSEYCRWLSDLRRWNPNIKKQLEMLNC